MTKIKKLCRIIFIVFFCFTFIENVLAENMEEGFRFSHKGGFYEDNINVEIISENTNSKIYYTLDGSEPNENSILYTKPIEIRNQAVDPKDGLSYIPTTPLDVNENMMLKKWIWKQPNGEINKATVVRAIEIVPSGEKSDILTSTYWVSNKYNLPVISIVVDKDDFFDYKKGIYVPGKDFDEKGWDSIWGSGNYRNDGDEWDRDVHIEFYENNNDRTLAFFKDVTVEIKGSASSVFPQKSLKIKDTIKYPIFPDEKGYDEKTIDKYKKVILRNAGQGFYFTHFQDAMMQKLVEDTDIAIQAYRPCIVFINGEYWGIHNIREENDEHYIESHYGVDSKEVDLLNINNEEEYGVEVDKGSKDHYISMMEFIENNDMTTSENYEKVRTMMDIDNYIDYMAAEIYFQNMDWPYRNSSLWRKQSDFDLGAPYGHDGRWRWLLYDTDYGFGAYVPADAPDGYSHNSIEDAETTKIFSALIENEEFKNEFINRMADFTNTVFTSETVFNTIDSMKYGLEDSIQEHIDRWGYPAENINEWNKQVDVLKNFAKHRPDAVRNNIMDSFKIDGLVNVELTLDDYKKGNIILNRTDIDEDTIGSVVNENSISWEGKYFKDIPIKIKAIPKEGYIFSYWEGVDISDKNNDEIIMNFNEDMSIKAHFVKFNKMDIQNSPNNIRNIQFNKPLDISTVNSDYFYVSKDELGKERLDNIKIMIDSIDTRFVMIVPSDGMWESGVYYIFVRPEVESIDGKRLGQMIRCKFIID